MESPPAADDEFEFVTWGTDDEYEVVERHSSPPPPPEHAQPVEGGNQASPSPARETIVGCDQGCHTKTIAQPTSTMSPQGAVAPTRSPSPPPQKAPAKDEKMKMASPLRSYDVALATDEAPRRLAFHDLMAASRRYPSQPQKAHDSKEEKVKMASMLRSFHVAAAMDDAKPRFVPNDLVAATRSPPSPAQVAVAATRPPPPQKAPAKEQKMKMGPPVRSNDVVYYDLVAAMPSQLKPAPPPPQVAVTATRPPSPPQKAPAKEENKMKMASPLRSHEVAAATDKAPRGLPVDTRGVSDLAAAPQPARGYAAVTAPPLRPSSAAYVEIYGEVDEDDETDDEDEYDDDYASYRSCYDIADFGRSKHVKRSSGRRGRTKKAALMGRPRGVVGAWRIAGGGNL